MILEEGHNSHLNLHPGMTNMYQDLKESFWWSGIKRDIARYVAAEASWFIAAVGYF